MSRLSSKSNSFHENHTRQRKIQFQTKLKIRGTNEYLDQSVLSQQNSQNKLFDIDISQNMRTNKSFTNYENKKLEFSQACNLLKNTNFGHHDSSQCFCSQCLCGRHLCRLHVIKPDLKKSTVYQNSFRRAKSIKNTPILQKQESRSLPKVEMNSTYSFSFKNKDAKRIVKVHPEDELRFQGPSQKLTSYGTNFPGNRGKNPYVSFNQKQVRPQQVFVSGEFPLGNRKSAYKQSYNNLDGFKKMQTGRINDQLKLGNNILFRESFYQQKFKTPNPEDYSSLVKNVEKVEVNPDFAHQYETSYDNEFVKIQSVVCPSKIKLQTRYKDDFVRKMKNFAQNSDFKALSSTFHALSTAPYGQYQ